MLIMFISINICLLKMYMTGSMFIKFGKCTKSVPLPNCDEMHHLLTCYASPQVKTHNLALHCTTELFSPELPFSITISPQVLQIYVILPMSNKAVQQPGSKPCVAVSPKPRLNCRRRRVD